MVSPQRSSSKHHLDTPATTCWASCIALALGLVFIANHRPAPRAVEDLDQAVVERQGGKTFYTNPVTGVQISVQDTETPVGSVWTGVKIVNGQVLSRALARGAYGYVCYPIPPELLNAVFQDGNPAEPTGAYDVRTCLNAKPQPPR